MPGGASAPAMVAIVGSTSISEASAGERAGCGKSTGLETSSGMWIVSS